MSRLDDMQKDISKMTDEELHALIRSTRADRRIKKGAKAAGEKKPRKASTKPAASMKDQVKKMLAGMSAEERMALIKKMGA